MSENRIHVGLCNGGNLAHVTGKYKHRAGFSAHDLDIYMTSPGLGPSELRPLAQPCAPRYAGFILFKLLSPPPTPMVTRWGLNFSGPTVPRFHPMEELGLFLSPPIRSLVASQRFWFVQGPMPEPISVPARFLLCADWCGPRSGVHTWRKGGVNTAFGLRECEGMDKCMVAKTKDVHYL